MASQGGVTGGVSQLALIKNYSLVGVVFGANIEKFPNSVRPQIQELLKWYTDGSLMPHISRTLPLAQVAFALNEIAARNIRDKIVLTV